MNLKSEFDFELSNDTILSKLAISKGMKTWLELIKFVSSLPYGRNKNRYDLSLVLKEGKGTCSSKHTFLKAVANEKNQNKVKLILGLYRMNNLNTPRIGNELIKHSLNYIPEAHCYLKIGEERLDITTSDSNFSKIEKSLIEEIEIEPNQVSEYKVEYHKKFIKEWIIENKIKYNFNEVWVIRENCIKNIENSN